MDFKEIVLSDAAGLVDRIAASVFLGFYILYIQCLYVIKIYIDSI